MVECDKVICELSDVEELKSESVHTAEKNLLKSLGTENTNTESTDNLTAIMKALKEKDTTIADMNDDSKTAILQAILRYKKICNYNDAENRCANTLQMFIKDIYKDSLHFFLEIIQNADDASKGGKEHCLKITVNKDNIIFEYDERGFNFSDLFAITSLGNSTKKAQLDENADIGEKGIGFKSIFAIVKEITIKSKYFGFSIENKENNLISILEPSEITLDKNPTTVLTLCLKDEYKTEEYLEKIKEWMEANITCKDIANPFLFLKNITSVSYENSDKAHVVELVKESIRDSKFSVITIGEQKYVKYSENMEFDKEAIQSRWKYLESELNNKLEDYKIARPAEICFPLNIGHSTTKGKIYSYLPTNMEVNFPVFINLDVHLTASRGNITKDDFASDSIWNKQVEANLQDFLKNAYLALVNNLSNDEDLKKLKEHLYHYIPRTPDKATTNSEIYNEQLQSFRSSIIEEAIFMTNKGEFKKRNEIACISSSLETITDNDTEIQALYDFMGEKSEELSTSRYKSGYINKLDENVIISNTYPFSKQWNEFVIDIFYSNCDKQYFYNAYDIVSSQKGVAAYWNNDESKRKNIEMVISILNTGCKYITKQNDYKEIAIIPVEGKNGFEVKNYQEITDNKALFFHSKDRSVEDADHSVYIYEKEENGKKSYAFEKIDTFIKDVYDIREYNLANYFDKKVSEIENSLSEESISEFILNTFKFYQKDKECFKKAQKIDKIQEFLCNYTFSKEHWEEHEGEAVNSEYVQAIADKLPAWDIPGNVDKNTYIDYLVFLGIKHKIDFDDGDIDEVSKEIMRSNPITIDEKNRFLTCNSPLTEYYLTTLNEFESISVENLKNYCKMLGVFEIQVGKSTRKDKEIQVDKYMREGKEIFVLEKKHIENINKEIEKLQTTEKDIYHLKDSRFCIIEKDTYSNIWRKLAVEDFKSIKDEFMNSFNKFGEKFLLDLRMCKLLNEVFNENYAWGHEKDARPKLLSLDAFLSCYKELTGEENLGELMKAGYKVKLENPLNAATYFDGYNDLHEFLGNMELGRMSLVIRLKYEAKIDLSIKESLSNILGKFAITNHEDMKENSIVFDKKSRPDKIYCLVKDEKEKSKVLCSILKALEIKIDKYQEKEIKDYFGEIKEVPNIPDELSVMGSVQYSEGVFFDFHSENAGEAKKDLPSIWDKNILKKLCIPFVLTDNQVIEGYGYQCAICGEASKSALDGMKFQRFENSGNGKEQYPYLYIVSCLNCNRMLRTAKSIEIENFDEIMKRFDICYCSDDNHVKNHVTMKTVILKVKTYNDRILSLPMKISYLNMALYKKLEI